MSVRLRALERDDLRFAHSLSNDSRVMSYWFNEPFDSLAELHEIYDRHIHDLRERRFVIEAREPEATGGDGIAESGPRPERVGVVELVEIDYIHRCAEFQIMIAPSRQGEGHATTATRLALDYAFAVLNLHKVYLIVSTENHGAIHIYRKAGFTVEGTLREEFFTDGRYRDALRTSPRWPPTCSPGTRTAPESRC
ncbi:GNAT family N-acetyltransferase [Actinokineospora iranica]|uniref:Diamine N-acetyltransferase n=1 Tax=Actinokineospora iranica TaxID=1271860 RepID=A0A1G6U1J6_9PSEU|nr:GNAT family N-acetyltransferase [Actinokineospora iranica]SDD35272.1 diamine N-acetyltransferase [Actinokineospora iranica]